MLIEMQFNTNNKIELTAKELEEVIKSVHSMDNAQFNELLMTLKIFFTLNERKGEKND